LSVKRCRSGKREEADSRRAGWRIPPLRDGTAHEWAPGKTAEMSRWLGMRFADKNQVEEQRVLFRSHPVSDVQVN
jgi:hypothetical protein